MVVLGQRAGETQLRRAQIRRVLDILRQDGCTDVQEIADGRIRLAHETGVCQAKQRIHEMLHLLGATAGFDRAPLLDFAIAEGDGERDGRERGG